MSALLAWNPTCWGKLALSYMWLSVSCRGNADLISRHNCLRDVLFAAARTATLSPRKELPALIPGSSSHPADVYLPCWHRGKPAAFDISVISPVQALTIDSAATIQGYALTVRERQKLP